MSVVGVDGEVAGQWTARRSDLARTPLIAAVPVAPGEYRVRAAAADEDGRGGVAEYPVIAGLSGTGAVKVSAIALGVSGADGFVPRLLFGPEPEAVAYFEAYDISASASVSAVVEIASTPEGAPIVTAPAKVSPGKGLHMVTASLPLAAVPAGDWIVRAHVTVGGAAGVTVLRALRKAGR